jgi:hypothetical protein
MINTLKFKNLKIFVICVLLFISVSCSENSQNTSKVESKEPTKVLESPLVKPKMGEISCTLPKGWISARQEEKKDSEVLSYIRKDDQKLWSNPGPIGTGGLPVMSLTVTLRDAKADKADLEPKKLGNSLVKQKVFTELLKAEEIKVANLPATIVVGNSPDRGHTSIIMLPHNGYLYKWTLDGTRETDMETAANFEAFLASAQIGK